MRVITRATTHVKVAFRRSNGLTAVRLKHTYANCGPISLALRAREVGVFINKTLSYYFCSLNSLSTPLLH